MMPSPQAIAIILSSADRATLEGWTRRRKTAQSLALRARIVLACAAPGATNVRVAKIMGVSRPTVATWRRRFAERGPDGLLDEPGSGRPRSITDEQVERAIVTTLEAEPADATHWSTRSLAKVVGLSQSAVVGIWHAFALQPHRCGTFKLSRDPLFVDKVRDISTWLRPIALWFCAWMKSPKSRPSSAPLRCCRCDRAKSSDGPMITCVTARPICWRFTPPSGTPPWM
jgi:transposase